MSAPASRRSPTNVLLTESAGGVVTTHSYDANGNRVGLNAGGALTSYAWDGENRLTRLSQADGTVETYTYAADGLRRSLASASGVMGFVWDGQNVLLETSGVGLMQAHYTDFPGAWGGLVSMRQGSASHWTSDASPVFIGTGSTVRASSTASAIAGGAASAGNPVFLESEGFF